MNVAAINTGTILDENIMGIAITINPTVTCMNFLDVGPDILPVFLNVDANFNNIAIYAKDRGSRMRSIRKRSIYY
jgi:hypothetical protein